VYQAAPGFEDHLEKELGLNPSVEPAFPFGGSLRYAEAAGPVFWRRNVWLRPFLLEFDSISEAARSLRAVQRNWAPVFHTQFRRGALIAAKLPPIPDKLRPFPWLLPDIPMGAWTLLDAHTLAASALCTSPFPGGVIRFAEDKEGPPSRAYLKLWESLVRSRRWPRPGERCLDAGASPGGWTWVLARLGAQVTACDRAPLDSRISDMTGPGGRPAVRYIKHDAFTLDPADLGPLDWVFCDVACYPPRLYDWVCGLLAAGLCRNFVCTLKMQGPPDNETARLFAEIPGAAVLHLCHNKHELTWIKIEPEGPSQTSFETEILNRPQN
jgi:23S rRNA (cytidine2498-2'-O)-methyltransferase